MMIWIPMGYCGILSSRAFALVLGGIALFAAFPLAFAIIAPAMCFPISVMLLGLIFRGVSFEFRFKDASRSGYWNYGFFGGSVIATFAQGMILGAFVQGFQVEGRQLRVTRCSAPAG
jgi:cytochrome bd ubiquinol oxidase subunit II